MSHRLNCELDSRPVADNIRDRILVKKNIPVAPRMHEGLLQYVLQVSDAESQLIFDANHAVKKLRRWKELMPRVKPFFGMLSTSSFVIIELSLCVINARL